MRWPACEQSCVKDLRFSSSHSVKAVILITLMKTLKLVSTHSLCDFVFFHPFTVILGGFEGGEKGSHVYNLIFLLLYCFFLKVHAP